MFVVIRVWNCPPYVRGYLRRFLSEPTSNLFVGNASRRVVDNLWARIIENEDELLRAFLLHTGTDNEQGFVFVGNGLPDDFLLEENEGIYVFGKVRR